MSHPEQARFVQLVRDLNGKLDSKARVLEVGSYDVYGSTRAVFSGVGEYIGIDLCPGPGVDLVANAHDLETLGLGKFDIILSCEALEHDPNWRLTVKNMVGSLSEKGVLIVTCATTLRPEHGTPRTSVGESPGTTSMGWDYYQNLSFSDLKDFLGDIGLSLRFKLWTNKKIFDLYCLVERTPDGIGDLVFPSDEDLKKIIDSTPVFYVALRWPIRVISKFFGVKNGERFGLIYWSFFTKNFTGHVRARKL